MKQGSILGYDLNEKYCQISYYDSTKDEPETLEVAVDHYKIPLVLAYFKDQWIYGKEAKRIAMVNEDCSVTDLYQKALKRDKIEMAGKLYDAVNLLAKFIELSLESFEEIDYITFTVPETDVDIYKMLRGIASHMGIPKNKVGVQDYKESFCYYMFYQPKELWQYESALFYCDAKVMKAYMLRKLGTAGTGGMFVTVDEVAVAQMEELEAIGILLDEEIAKNADERFQSFIQNVFEKKVISSVFLTGEGFEQEWYPGSLRVLCNGRRAFMGNNLYSKGACYTSMRRNTEFEDGPTYLDETMMTEQISLRMRVDGKEGWYPVVNWGRRWYESDGKWEVLLEDASDVEILVESLTEDEMQVETVSMEGLPERRDYSLRLQVEVLFLDEDTCRFTFKDIGFGEFYPSSGFKVQKTIHLGGSNGQFNSMSR